MRSGQCLWRSQIGIDGIEPTHWFLPCRRVFLFFSFNIEHTLASFLLNNGPAAQLQHVVIHLFWSSLRDYSSVAVEGSWGIFLFFLLSIWDGVDLDFGHIGNLLVWKHNINSGVLKLVNKREVLLLLSSSDYHMLVVWLFNGSSMRTNTCQRLSIVYALEWPCLTKYLGLV